MNFKSKLEKVKRPNWLVDRSRDPNKLWLDKNENSDEILAKEIKKELDKIDSKAIYAYPNLAPLYKKLSKILKLNPKNILLTAGTDAGIKAVFETFINEKDLVLRTEPTFAMYSVYSKIFNVKEILLNYKKTNSGPKIDLNTIINIILKKRPKLICLPNPDSPTGHYFLPEEIETLLKTTKKTNTFVLIDEAYYPFYRHSSKEFIKKYQNLIITRTTAKAWGLAGLRVGYVLSSRNIIKEMHKVRPMYEINNVGAELFKIILNRKRLVESSVKRLLRGKLYFKKELLKLGFDVFEKEEGNFIHVNFKKFRHKIIKELSKNVYFRHKESHESLKDFSRFALTSEKNFKMIIEKIKKHV